MGPFEGPRGSEGVYDLLCYYSEEDFKLEEECVGVKS